MRFAVTLIAVGLLVMTGCKMPGTHNLPPANQLLHPGPGVDGPGPGVMMLSGAGPGGPPGAGSPTSQLAFSGPESMTVMWDVSCAGAFDSVPLVVPGRFNFPQGGLYRLKLSTIASRPGVELYPTIEVAPYMPRTEAFLEHQAIPIQVTEEDLDQVITGNFVTKVIYLPDAEFQDLAVAGVETLVSTRLDPGVDPIVEADRRGAILAIFRMGNKDLEMPGAIPYGEGPYDGQEEIMQTSAMMPVDENGMPVGGPGMPCGPGMQCAPGMPCPVGAPGIPANPRNCPSDMAAMGVAGVPGSGGVYPQQYVAGMSSPEWGMPMSGTPIGLPGPPHIPLGGPAGLRKHTIKNHTFYHMPKPTKHLAVHVKQKPGFSYPKPANTVRIHENTVAPPAFFRQPLGDKSVIVSGPPAGPGGVPCP